ncbi:MAG: FecR domain-containing protein [Alphaproteobacteria bacterium]|nr:FecR domain-containing protein [Alphaproteobacteria bacterium]
MPSAHLLSTASYERLGPDLILQGEGGERFIISDFFATSTPPDLISEDGASISGDLAARLAGPLAPGQFAQVGNGIDRHAIGRADTLSGDVAVIHADGSKAILHKGDAVFQGDVLQTPKGASVGLVFMDGTSLALGSNGRMVLDQMVYDPATQSGKSAFSLIQGSFSFMSGQIAKTSPDAMTIRTPVATIGIRGTLGVGEYTPGHGLTAAIVPERGEVTGEIAITNAAGTQVLNQPSTALQVGTFFTPPSTPVVVSAAQLTSSFAQSLAILPQSNAAQPVQEQLRDIRPDMQGPRLELLRDAPLRDSKAATSTSAPRADEAFAQTAQQAIDQALERGLAINDAQNAAMRVKSVFEKAVGSGLAYDKAMLQAGEMAAKLGLLAPGAAEGKNPFLTMWDIISHDSKPIDVATLSAFRVTAAQAVTVSESAVSAIRASAAVQGIGGTDQVGNSRNVSSTSSDYRNDVVSNSSGGSSSSGKSSTSGKAVDGYIEGATVFADANMNGQWDAGEARSTTGVGGAFTLTGGSGPIVVQGGIDASTGEAFTGVLTAPAGSTVVTPLTTLMDSMIRHQGLSADQAKAKVAEAAGVSSSVDLTKLDPVAASLDPAQASVASQIMAAGVKIHNTVVQAANLILGAASSSGVDANAAAQALYKSMAATMIANGAATDLSSSTTQIESLITNAAGSGGLNLGAGELASLAAAKTQAAEVIKASNAAIEELSGTGTSFLTDLAKIAIVAQTSSAQAIQEAVADPTKLETLVNRFSGAALDAAVSQVDAASVGASASATDGDDTLSGTTGADSISGLGGNDRISGGVGDDRLLGNAGNDLIYGGGGNDWLSGSDGNDQLSGGEGQDSAAFSGAMADYSATVVGKRLAIIGEGNDLVWDVERLGFSDGDLTLSLGGGQRFQVNEHDHGNQARPSMASFQDGRWLSLWESSSQDGSGTAVMARLFDAQGRPQAEFQVNTGTQGDQSSPRAAVLADGTAVVLWRSAGQDGDQGGIYAQRIGSDGLKQGAEFCISDQGAGEQRMPDVVALKDGGFAASWVEASGRDGSGSGVYARLYTPTASDVFQISQTSAGNQESPVLAALANGGLTAVWTQADGVYARSFDATGAPIGGEFRLTSQVGIQPDVVQLADGNLVAAWRQTGAGGNIQGKGVLFSSDGATVGSVFALDLTANLADAPLTLAAMSDGRFAAAWTGLETTAAGTEIEGVFARRFEANGTPSAASFRVSLDDGATAGNAAVASLPGGDFIVAWEDLSGRDGDQSGIYQQRYAPDGTAYGYTVTASDDDNNLAALGGFATIDGGDGTDTLNLKGAMGRFKIEAADGGFAVVDRLKDAIWGDLGSALVLDVENLSFADGEISIISDDGGIQLVGGDGNDIFTLGKGVTQVSAGDGNDILRPDGKLDLSGLVFDGGDGLDALHLGIVHSVTDADFSGLGSVERVVVEANLHQASVGLGERSEATGVEIVQVAAGAGDSVIDASARTQTITLVGGGGDDSLIGGGGSDVAVFSGNMSGYRLRGGINEITVTDINAADGNQGTDTLKDIEILRFADGDIRLVPGNQEFRANTTTTGAQTVPEITGLKNGGYVVSWSGNMPGDSYGVAMQIYDANGVPVGNESQINTYTASAQLYSSHIALDDGGFVALWTSYQDGSYYGVYGQRFDGVGQKIGSEFRINTYTSGYQDRPKGALLDGGQLAVVWQSDDQDGSGYGVYAQLLDYDGQKIGSEFQVNELTNNHQINPRITPLEGGGFAVVWCSLADEATNYNVHCRIYNENGTARTAEFQANVLSQDIQYTQHVAGLGDGSFVVVWQSNPSQDGNGIGAFMRRFAADGQALTGDIQVNTYTISSQGLAAVASLENGGFVVAWQSYGQDGSGYGIFGQRYNANGEKAGGEFAINTFTPGDQSYCEITGLSDGGFAVTWRSWGVDGSDYGTAVRRFDANGDAVGLPVLAGGAGNDVLRVQTGFDVVAGGAGSDSLLGSTGADTFLFAAGDVELNEQIDGGGNVDTLQVAGDNDFSLASLSNVERMEFVGAAKATFSGSQIAAIAEIIGNEAGNTVEAVAGLGATVSLSSLVFNEWTALQDSILLRGASGNESLTGTAYADTLEGGAGADKLAGGASDDVFTLAAGDVTAGETIDGGSGTDTLLLTGSNDFRHSEISLVSIEALTFAAEDEASATLRGSHGMALTRVTGDGNANHIIVNGATDGTVSLAGIGTFLSWTDGVDSIALNGATGNETLIGTQKSDVIRAGAGDDVIIFDANDSLVDGETGTDTLRLESDVDFRAIEDGVILNIEVLDLAGSGGRIARLSEADVLAFSGETDTLTVTGDSSDLLYLHGNWINSGASWTGGGATIIVTGDVNVLQSSAAIDSSGGSEDGIELFLGSRTGYRITGGAGGATVTDIDAGDGANEGSRFVAAGTTLRFQDGDLALSETAGEFRINTTTDGVQRSPAVAALKGADGGYVAVWDGKYPDDSTAIVMQRYDAAGTPVGSETRVNTALQSNAVPPANIVQSNPAVQGLADGSYVVAWQSSPQDGNGYGIYMQRFDANGQALGVETRVNSYVTYDQINPAITVLSDGGFLVAWQSNVQDSSGYGVYAQRYDADGAAQGAERYIPTNTSYNQWETSLAGLTGGGYVAVWSSMQAGSGTVGYDIYYRIVKGDGTNLTSGLLANNTQTDGQTLPAVTALQDGGFVVAWQSAGQDGEGTGIYLRRFNASGTAQGEEAQVNVTSTYDQSQVALTTLSNGRFVVTWQSGGQDGSGSGIFARLYSAAGVAQGDEFQVNSFTNLDQSFPSISALADGGFVVTWQSVGQDGSDNGIFGQRFDASGQPVGSVSLTGSNGTDILVSGGAFQAIDGGSGADTLLGGSGRDYFRFDEGDIEAGETISGGGGTDRLLVSGNNDFRLALLSGVEEVWFEDSGTITLSGQQLSDMTAVKGDAGSGVNLIQARASLDGSADLHNITFSSWNAGNDSIKLLGGSGNETLAGSDAAEGFWGYAGADSMSGGGGNDVFAFNTGDVPAGEVIDGGAGIDTLTMNSSTDFSLATISNIEGIRFTSSASSSSTATFSGSQVSGFTSLTGDAYANKLVINAEEGGTVTLAGLTTFVSWSQTGDSIAINGSDGNETLTGSAWRDTISGGSGNDVLNGGAEKDTLLGGEGDDTLILDAQDMSVDGQNGTDTLRLLASADFRSIADGVIRGIEQIDLITGSNITLRMAVIDALSLSGTTDQVLIAGDSNDHLVLYGSWTLTGQQTINDVSYNVYDAGVSASGHAIVRTQSSLAVTLAQSGGSGNDTLTGTSDGDILAGDAGNDVLSGLTGNDELNGDAGNDTLSGEDGNDLLNGGIGADIALFSGSMSGYRLSAGVGVITVTDTDLADGDSGTDTLYNVETLRFSDGDLSLARRDEFRVNTTTDGKQQAPRIAALADGGYVIAFDGIMADGRVGVAAQRYDAFGVPAGAEAQVNTIVNNDQYAASVAGLADGGFVVTWHTYGLDGNSTGIALRRFDANGQAIGEETAANTYTIGVQNNPEIAAFADGGYVVTWSSNSQDGSGYGIFGQRFDANGLKAGSEFRVNETTADSQYAQKVSAIKDGGFAVTWGSLSTDGSDFNVFARLYDASGNAATGEFMVNQTVADRQHYPYIAALNDGRIAVAWASNLQDGNYMGVYLRLYDSQGQALGGETRINTYISSNQTYPTIASLEDGGFIVSWMSYQDGSDYGIYAQRYGSDGLAAGGEFRVNSYTAAGQGYPRATGLPDGGFVITWQSNLQDGSGLGVYAQRYDSNSNPIGLYDLTGGMGNDVLYAESGFQAIAGGGGADTLIGGDGADAFRFAAGDAVAGERIDGGAGIDVLQVLGSNDLSLATLVSIERLRFQGAATITLSADQAEGIALATGDANINAMTVNAATGGTADLSAISFLSWTAGSDSVILNGAAGNETLTGSNECDIISAGGGDDIVIFIGEDFVAGESVEGGAGTDTLKVLGDTDFNLGSVTGFEALAFAGEAEAGFGSAQIVDISTVTGDANANTLVVMVSEGSSIELSGKNFASWTSQQDIILLIGSQGSEFLSGSSHDDTIDGGTGADTLLGGAGNDVFLFAAGDAIAGETIDGGSGTDTLRLSDSNDFSYATLSSIESLSFASAATATLLGSQAGTLSKIAGSVGVNSLVVTGASDLSNLVLGTDWSEGIDSILLQGGIGGDIIIGSGLDDTLSGAAGADRLTGGAGNDIFTLAAGDFEAGESLIGGTGNDSLVVSGSNDLRNGDISGVESIVYVADATIALTHAQLSEITTISGGAGGDNLIISASNSATIDLSSKTFLSWTAGEDGISLVGAAGAETLIGSANADTFCFASGDAIVGDSVDGAAGNDVLLLLGSNDFTNASMSSVEYITFQAAATATLTGDQAEALLGVTGDAGQNRVAVQAAAGETVSLAGIADFASWTSSQDWLILSGAGGNENLTGSIQADSLCGGAGADHLAGGSGNDVFVLAASDVAAGELIDGGGGSDSLYLTGSNDLRQATLSGLESLVFAGEATARLLGSQTAQLQTIAGNANVNTVIVEALAGTSVSLAHFAFDSWSVGSDALSLVGAAGSETLIGTSQRDTIIGGTGADTLLGGGGSDIFLLSSDDIAAGETIDGGAGSDVLLISADCDFTQASLVSIEGLSYSGAVTANLTSSQVGGLTTVTGDGNANILAVSAESGGSVSLAAITSFISWTDGVDKIEISGLEGDETLTGSSQTDTVLGGLGNDMINGGGGADSLFGEDGDDTFLFAASSFAFGETVNGGAGTDVLRLTGSNNFSAGSLSSIEILSFSASATATLSASQFEALTSISGDDNANTVCVQLATDDSFDLSDISKFLSWSATSDAFSLIGAGGSEIITGSVYGDFISGGGGADSLSGGTGNDRFGYAGGEAVSGEAIEGGEGIDALVVSGSENFALVTLGAIEGVEFAGTASASFSASQIGLGLSQSAAIVGDSHDNTLTISAQADEDVSLAQFAFTDWTGFDDWVRLIGASGNENLTATSQSDSISGLGGDDVLIGLGGGDLLRGGSGSDLFVERTGQNALSSSASSLDVIEDFNWFLEGDRLYFLDNDGNHMTVANGYHAGDLSQSAQDLEQALALAFADANGSLGGTVVLGEGDAVMFDYSGTSYVAVADAAPGYQSSGDAVVAVDCDANPVVGDNGSFDPSQLFA